MYIPRRYEEKDHEKVQAFIRENSFAILISVLDGVPVATHIPLLLEKDGEGRDVLVGHIARGNGQKGSFAGGGLGEGGAKVLAITTWSAGTAGKRCGAVTQGPLLAPQRGWIDSVLKGWGLL